MAAGFGHACGLRVISLPSGHGSKFILRAPLGVKCEGPKLARILPLWQGPRAMREAILLASVRLSSCSLAAVAQW
jgi:hypothetical protein